VIKVENDRVCFTAIATRVLTQILDHPSEVLMPVPRLHRVQAVSGTWHAAAYE